MLTLFFLYSIVWLFFLILFLLFQKLGHFVLVLIFLDLLLLVNILLLVGLAVYPAIAYSYIIFILSIAASDTAVGLGVVTLYYRTTGLYYLNHN